MSKGSQTQRTVIAALAVLTGVGGISAQEVRPRGSSVAFPLAVTCSLGARQVTLNLTGAALRKKLVFNVYAIASYLAKTPAVKTPEQLAEADVPKQLRMVLERDVAGPDVADNFKRQIFANYPDGRFAAETAELAERLASRTAHKGELMCFTHIPKTGLRCELAGREPFVIRNQQFSRALWSIYLGRKNLGAEIKQALVARL